MDSAIKTAVAAPFSELQTQLTARLDRADELRDAGDLDAAITILETALTEAGKPHDPMDFQVRVTLAMTLADFYTADGRLQKARENLAREVSDAEEMYRAMHAAAAGQMEKRMFFRGLTILRDHLTQLTLIGEAAPEIAVKRWLNSDPLTLAGLRGHVVLLEFWATWCKPCQAMFPELKKYNDDYAARGLRILALTRHYFADLSTADSQESELELIRSFVRDHGLDFPVGIAEDAGTQSSYGATGMPTLALIDRQGRVRCYHSDPDFDEVLQSCLNESA